MLAESEHEFTVGTTVAGEPLCWRVRRASPFEVSVYGGLQLTMLPASAIVRGIHALRNQISEPQTDEEMVDQVQRDARSVPPANLRRLYEANAALLKTTVIQLRVGSEDWQPVRLLDDDDVAPEGCLVIRLRQLPPGVAELLASEIYAWSRGGVEGSALLERFRPASGDAPHAG